MSTYKLGNTGPQGPKLGLSGQAHAHPHALHNAVEVAVDPLAARKEKIFVLRLRWQVLLYLQPTSAPGILFGI